MLHDERPLFTACKSLLTLHNQGRLAMVLRKTLLNIEPECNSKKPLVRAAPMNQSNTFILTTKMSALSMGIITQGYKLTPEFAQIIQLVTATEKTPNMAQVKIPHSVAYHLGLAKNTPDNLKLEENAEGYVITFTL